MPFHLDSWNRTTAVEFLSSLGHSYAFTLDDASITRLLDKLRDPVPYHVQLFFSALRDVCLGDAARVSPEAVEQCFAERLSGASGTAYLDHYATRLEIALDEHEHAMAVGILQIACRRARGVTAEELEDLRRRDERTFASVLRDLESDGYLRQENERLEFRSNLLREWWRKHYRRADCAMIRRRLYNPAQLTPEELKASFVARGGTLAEMLRFLREQTPGRPCQYMMLIGPRGMGKTTLGLRFLHAVEESPELAAIWQPVPFHEESYGIGDLADFWLAALHHLSRATDNPEWADKAEALAGDQRDQERVAAHALAALTDNCQTSDRRLILFVENLDGILHQLRDEREAHALRASLIERPEILLLGSANAVFDAIRSHAQPFYEFFRLVTLEGIGAEDTAQLLDTLARQEGRPDLPQALNLDHGRLETLRRLTGGNPRLLVLACRMLIESPLGSAFEDLEQLIDEQTPYFKARIEELPIQARKVFDCLANGWTPMLAKEVAGAAKLSSSHASAQLKQLVERGYAQEIRMPGAKRTRYEVGDRFYNIYYVLRFSRTNRRRLERLVAFLHDLFGTRGLQPMYPTFLDALRLGGPRTVDSSDWLEIVARYVAADPDYQDREDWLRRALEIANELIGPDAPVAERIENAFVGQHPPKPPLLGELMQRGDDHFQANQFIEAEEAYREALAMRPDNLPACWKLGMSLLLGGRNEDAIVVLEQFLEQLSPHDPLESRNLIVAGLAGRSIAYSRLGRLEAAAKDLEQVSEYIGSKAPSEHYATFLEVRTVPMVLHLQMQIDSKNRSPRCAERPSTYVRMIRAKCVTSRLGYS